jgi:PTH1 family peptidyl-tRNA hydrolase
MKLVVGFGNPESKYNFTRHNTGFLVLDFYAKVKGLTWSETPKFNALWLKSGDAIFIKPETYYNNVGESIQTFAKFYKIPTSDILIVCDDFNLDFGKMRLRTSGSAGGNNGLKSTIARLNTEDFTRLRLGTDNASRIGSNLNTGEPTDHKISDIDFVLSKFTPEEKTKLPEILHAAVSQIDNWLES